MRSAGRAGKTESAADEALGARRSRPRRHYCRIWCPSALAAALVWGVLAQPAAAVGTPRETPLAVVTATVNGVVAVLADPTASEHSRRRRVRAIIGERFDFVAMSKRVLATNWSKASRAQRARFTVLFRDLLSNTYWRRLADYANETG